MPDLTQALRELQETAIVMAGIQAKQAKMLKDHAKWLVEHDRAITEARERGKATDERIEQLVIAIGEFIRRRDGK
jgi:hypothetical protein